MIKAKIMMLTLAALMIFSVKLTAQTKANNHNKQKTVLLIYAHLTYPGWSEGNLNRAFYQTAKAFFLSKSYTVLETRIEDGYQPEEEVEKHLMADIVILQTPVNWENTPWIYKKYVDEVFNSALKSKKFLSGDGRSEAEGCKQYGMGGKMQGKKFMISATWNAPKESFNDRKQYLFKGRSADDALFNVTANYLFTGYEVLPGYYCYDVYHNKHIKEDIGNYPKYLKKVLDL